MFGFSRLATAVPTVKVADVQFNASQIIALAAEAENNDASVVVFPELSLTGYTCADLFHQSQLLTLVRPAIETIGSDTQNFSTVIVFGAPMRIDNTLYNCAVIMQHGEVKGIGVWR